MQTAALMSQRLQNKNPGTVAGMRQSKTECVVLLHHDRAKTLNAKKKPPRGGMGTKGVLIV
jgi:hypothetical protein